MTAKRYRWVCPTCGVGALGSKAPRRDATVRYCLPYSAKSPTLVARTCPALDKAREAAEEKRRAKDQRQRESARNRKAASKRYADRRREQREAARVEAVGDLYAELERIWPIAVGLSRREAMPTRLPALTIRSRGDDHTSGRCWPHAHRLCVSVGRKCDHAVGLGTLAHEVAHLLTPDDEPSHGRGFWSVLVDLTREAYGTALTIADLDREPNGYQKQAAVEAAIRCVRSK